MSNVRAWPGNDIWLLSYLSIKSVQVIFAKVLSDVNVSNAPVVLASALQALLPSRRAALAFISSLPFTPSEAARWDWTDSFIPRNSRREDWQEEVEIAQLDQEIQPKVNSSDDRRRIVTQVGSVRCNRDLSNPITQYEAAVDMDRAQK